MKTLNRSIYVGELIEKLQRVRNAQMRDNMQLCTMGTVACSWLHPPTGTGFKKGDIVETIVDLNSGKV